MMTTKLQYFSSSPQKTQKIAKEILSRFKEIQVFCLFGNLGSGKTCFCKGVGEYFKIPPNKIKSPTYTFCREYFLTGEKKFYHYDLYRLNKSGNIKDIGLTEVFENKNKIIVIEWADRIQNQLPGNRLDIYFKTIDDNKREILVLRQVLK